MRISDWSSDVCSSDVGYQNNGGWIDKPNDRNANDSEVQNYRIRVKAQPADALTIDLIASNYHSHADAPNSSFPDLTTPSSAAEPQIGRASCRERVCQYG